MLLSRYLKGRQEKTDFYEIFFKRRVSNSTGCSRTQYITKDELEHLIPLPPPPETWITGMCYHTLFMWSWRLNLGLCAYKISILLCDIHIQPSKIFIDEVKSIKITEYSFLS